MKKFLHISLIDGNRQGGLGGLEKPGAVCCDSCEFGFFASELLPSLDDHIAIQRVEFHQECPTTCLLGSDQGRTTAAE